MSIANLPSHYLTVTEVAEIMRVSKMTVYRLVRDHALASVRIGRSYRIPENALEEYLREAGETPES
jgi:excisionase family DNA binding protein